MLETFYLFALRDDETQKLRLLEVCKPKGSFYLDLEGSEFASLPTTTITIGTTAEDLFRLPEEEKEKYACGVSGNKLIYELVSSFSTRATN